MSYSQTTSPSTNFGTTTSCCATTTNGFTIGISEATSTNGKLPTIQFHAAGSQEAFFRLSSDSRVFEIGENASIGVDFAIRNPTNTLRSVYLSGKGLSYFNGGNVGIGTSTPSEKLDVIGNVQLSGTIKFGNSGSRTEHRNNAGLQGNAGAVSGFFESYDPQNYPTSATSWWHLIDSRHSNVSNNYAMQFAGSFFDQKLFFRKTNNNPAQLWKEVIMAETNGSVGIATTTIPNDYKLAVGGNIIAEKVVVKLKTDWPDYVFKTTYRLCPLEEVELYINQNKHLPEVPSADEISKTGIDLGQINTKLLQKVEELTLYLISQHKELKMQNNKLENLQNEVQQLRNRK